MAKQHVSFNLNGKKVDALVEPRDLLVHTIRETLNLTGTHIGCESSHCGACTVDLNGKSVKSCTVLSVQADGADLKTVEGLADAEGLHALQKAFIEEHGLQWEAFVETWFYSDSLNDLPLLQIVSHPVVVDPDETLKEHALAQDWPMISLR